MLETPVLKSIHTEAAMIKSLDVYLHNNSIRGNRQLKFHLLPALQVFRFCVDRWLPKNTIPEGGKPENCLSFFVVLRGSDQNAEFYE